MQQERYKFFIFPFFLILVIGSIILAQKSDDIEVYVIHVNGRAGLVNRAGEIVIKPEFAAFGEYNADCSCIWAMDENRLWGTINLQGQWIVQPKYIHLTSASGKYLVVKEPGRFKKYRFIDNFGNYFFDEFDYARPFSEGLAAVRVNDRWGYIDQKGKLVIPLSYRNRYEDRAVPYLSPIGDFSEGLAKVHQDEPNFYIRQDNSIAFNLKKGFSGGSFSDGRAIVRNHEKDGIIDSDGKVILPPTYSEIEDFSNDLAAFRNGVFWGYLNKEGVVVIDPIFDSADDFDCGLAPVRLDGKWGFIDKTGKFVIEPKYDEVGTFQNGLVNVEQNGEDLFIDRTGKVVIKFPKPLKSM